jgi:PAS domain S-box-containing protein
VERKGAADAKTPSCDSGELHRSDKLRYRAAVEGQMELVCRFRPDGTLTSVNDACCRYFGLRRDDLIGYSFLSLCPEEAHELENLRILTLENPVRTVERRTFYMGDPFWQQWTDRGIFDNQGRLVEIRSAGHDITERRTVENERDRLLEQMDQKRKELEDLTCVLERERSTLKAIMENTSANLAYMNLQFNILRVNSGYARCVGCSQDELIGRSYFDLFPGPRIEPSSRD